MGQNQPQIIKVKELLTNDNLKIPSYQRPYKRTTKNVNQLIDDVLIHKEKSEYRLGTLVVHNHDGISDIVDGQQRTITLTLIAYAITQKQNKTKEEEKALKSFDPKLLNLSFANDISKSNAKLLILSQKGTELTTLAQNYWEDAQNFIEENIGLQNLNQFYEIVEKIENLSTKEEQKNDKRAK